MPYPTSEVQLNPAGSTAPFWLTPAAYWQPAHIVTSAWLEHAPFAFWLMDALRPSKVVELGTHFGFSMFVFAEAAKRLALDTRLSALDTWQGDDQAGFYGDDVYRSVDAVARAEYPDTVELVRGYFDESRSRFDTASVDLLHIDGRHGYEDVRADYLAYAETVRDGGVILFHDIAEREGGFGVWRLWEELAAEHRTFAFEHGHGLGVLAVGEPAPALRPLFECGASTGERVRADFSSLGHRVTRQGEYRAMPAEIDSLHEVVDSLLKENRRLAEVIAERDAALHALRSTFSWRLTRPLRAIRRPGRRRG